MSNISDYLKIIGNDFASVASDGIAAGDISGFTDTGSYALNALCSGSLYGGIANGKITLIGAPSSTGKSFLAQSFAKSFLDIHKDGFLMHFESEGAVTKDGLAARGIDVNRTLNIPVQTVEDFRSQCLKMISHHQDALTKASKSKTAKPANPVFMVLDSMGMLSTNKELEDSESGSGTKDMTRAGLLKATFRTITLKLSQTQIPFVVTNHTYEAIGQGPYAASVNSGGTGAVYAASIDLRLSKAMDKDTDGVINGVIVTVTAAKSRLTREKLKVKCAIRHSGGLERYYYLAELCEMAGIFEKVGTKIKLPDGTLEFGKRIRKNPEKYFTNEVMQELEKWVNDNFKYGGENVEEVIDFEGDSSEE